MRLFKYYPPSEYSFRSLARQGLWCHRAENMNDPFDCLGLVNRRFDKIQLDVLRDILSQKGKEKHKRWLRLQDDELSLLINEQRRNSIEKYAFCALSETNDDILMWSHYAKSHTGFVMEFEFPELLDDHHLQKVNYSKILPDFDLEKYGNFMTGGDNLIHYLLQDISLKSTEWCYEKEWRIWRRNPSYYHYSSDNVKAIYFGVNCEQDTQETIVKLTDYLGGDSPLYQMEFRADPVRLIW